MRNFDSNYARRHFALRLALLLAPMQFASSCVSPPPPSIAPVDTVVVPKEGPDTTAKYPSVKSALVRSLAGLAIGAAVGGFLGYETGKAEDKNCTQECGISPVLGFAYGAVFGGFAGFIVGLLTAMR